MHFIRSKENKKKLNLLFFIFLVEIFSALLSSDNKAFFSPVLNKPMSSSQPPSPTRHRGGSREGNGEERPRFFDSKAKIKCWSSADVVPGRHPERWRKDAAGNVVCKRFCNCQGCLCFEYDHVVPFSKGASCFP